MPFSSKNMQYAFQWEYQNAAVHGGSGSLNEELLQVMSKEVLAEVIPWSRERAQCLENMGARSLLMKVLYPGMLVGTGYPHETGKMTGEIQMGFSFDYVTGLPYYPGSSLKGVLRTPFARALQLGEQVDGESALDYQEYLQELFQGAGVTGEIGRNDLEDFLSATFEGMEPGTEEGIPISARDVFYDSYPVGVTAKNGALLGLDNITPHMNDKGEHSVLVEPTPLTMLRILPGTHLLIQMKLQETRRRDGSVLATAEQKLAIFRQILLDMGIGAKTHVGYGLLKLEEKTPNELEIGGAKKDVPQPGKPTGPKGNTAKKHSARPTIEEDDMPDWKRKLMGFGKS